MEITTKYRFANKSIMYINFYAHDGCFIYHVAHLRAEGTRSGEMRGGYLRKQLGKLLVES